MQITHGSNKNPQGKLGNILTEWNKQFVGCSKAMPGGKYIALNHIRKKEMSWAIAP